MRTTDPTLFSDNEPTYTRAQWVAGILTSIALAGTLALTIFSLISAL